MYIKCWCGEELFVLDEVKKIKVNCYSCKRSYVVTQEEEVKRDKQLSEALERVSVLN